MVNQYVRLAALCRRFKFEFIKLIGVFKLVRLLGMNIKEPYNTLYERSKK